MDIMHLEMLNILVAIRVWKHCWSGKSKILLIHCDNYAVVSVLNSGKTRDRILAALGRNICMEAAEADMHIHPVHIFEKHNTATDDLSR